MEVCRNRTAVLKVALAFLAEMKYIQVGRVAKQ